MDMGNAVCARILIQRKHGVSFDVFSSARSVIVATTNRITAFN